MSNQLQITGGAKVRSLEGVITGTTGVLGSLPINTANGIPQLDSNGKILVSQLPNSVMEYLGTWNAATNTPTLVNGTGNAGDVYLCNVAGTTNFGAGPITFFVGDQVIYSGSIWQRASGATGTVTSVAVTESGDALSITGSPITTIGTINIGFAGTSAQYVAGNGSLITFPTLTGYVPYTGATADVNLGAFDLYTSKVWLYDNPNSGYGSMELTDGVLHFEDADGHSMVTMEDGYFTIANASTIRALLNVSGLTANRDYAFPNASGTLALTSDLSGYVPTSRTISTTSPLSGGGALSSNLTLSISQANTSTNGYLSSTDWNTFNNKQSALTFISPLVNTSGTISIPVATTSVNGYLSSTDWNTFNNKQNALGFVPIGGSGSINYISKFTGSTIISQSGIYEGVTNYVSIGNTNTTYNLDVTGTARVTGDVSFGNALTLTGSSFLNSMTHIKQVSVMYPSTGYTTIAGSSTGLTLNTGGSYTLDLSFPTTASYTYTFPSATGTLALTSQIPTLSGTAPISYSAGVISISQATTSTNGYLSSTDWNTFNGKQNALTNPVTGTGTANYHAKFTGTSTLGNSGIYEGTSGYVSIGNTNSTYNLDVTGTGRFTSRLFVDGNLSGNNISFLKNTSSTGYGLSIQGGTSSNYALYIADYAGTQIFQMLGSGAATFSSSVTAKSGLTGTNTAFATNDSSGYGVGIGYVSGSYGYITSQGGSSPLVFSIDGTEKVRLTTGGNVGIGTTSPGYPLDVNGYIKTSGSSSGFMYPDRQNGVNYILYGNDNGYTYFYNSSVGNIARITMSNGVYLALSDSAKKKDFEVSTIGLNEVLQLKPTLYRMKSDDDNAPKQLGFIAQEVKPIIPQAYSESGEGKDKFIGLQDRPIIAALVKSVQEIVDKYDNKISILESQIEELKAKING